MRRIVLVVIIAVLLSLSGFHLVEAAQRAVQVELTPVELVQPDGLRFVAQPFGDEWYNGYEHADYTILQNSAGVWVYAISDVNGALLPSSVPVGLDRTPPPNATPHLRDHVQLAQVPQHNQPRAAQQWEGAFGSQAVLVLLVDFVPSTSLGSTAAQWHAAFFDNTAGAKSVKNFYEEASFGAFNVEPAQEIQGAHNDGIIEITLDKEHPNTRGSTGGDNRALTADALAAANQYIDFSHYDLDGSGGIDVTELHLIVIPRGYETAFGGASAACSPSVWGHRWSLYFSETPTLDGVRVGGGSWGGGYMQFGEWQDTDSNGCPGAEQGNKATIGIMVHELGHDINWPDLYDVDQSTSGIGYWSVMASGSWGRQSGEASGATPTLPDAFSKVYQRWITPTVVSGSQIGVSVGNSAENPTVYQLGDNPDGIDWSFGSSSGTGEYFLVENRQQVGFDRGLRRISSSASGLLIWHIDESVTQGNSANADETRRLIDVVEANPVQDMEISTNRGDRDDVWPGSNGYTSFGAGSVPNSNWYDGSVSGVSVENIAVARGAISADFSAPPLNTPTNIALHSQATRVALVQLFVICGLLLVLLTVRIERRQRRDAQ